MGARRIAQTGMGHLLGVRLPRVPVLKQLTFQRSLLESTVGWLFDLRVVNVQTFALWVLLGFLDVREGRPGVFRDKVYWWIGFFVDNHGYWEMGGEGGVFRAWGTPVDLAELSNMPTPAILNPLETSANSSR